MRAQGRLSVVLAVLLIFGAVALAHQSSSEGSSRPIVVQGTLIAPGSTPFHLKAVITEGGDPAPIARVEMFWVAPDKWRRVIQSDVFGQTLVVNGDKVFEQDADDYFPLGLQTLLTAMVDPKPVLDAFRPGDMVHTKANGASSESGAISFGNGMIASSLPSTGLVESVDSAGHGVEFTKYEEFKGKRIARILRHRARGGESMTARVTDLEELKKTTESLFAISEPTPVNRQIRSVMVPQAELHGPDTKAHEIIWPQVLDGNTTGTATFYISVDRTGRVREANAVRNDNMQSDDSALRQIMKWKFKPVMKDGAPVQAESLLSFALNTRAWGPPNPLSDAEVRKLATNVVEPVIPKGAFPAGAECTLRVAIDDEGKLIETIANGAAPGLCSLCEHAMYQWHFSPVLINGKPLPYRAEIKFRAP
jgi:hypothetical protein